MRVILSPAAEDDLIDIANFIAGDSLRRAISFIRELRADCLGLSHRPKRFPIVLTRNDVTIRRAVHGRYSIFFVVRQAEVYVLRILNSARDYEKIF